MIEMQFEYKIKYSVRRNITIKVNRDETVEVRAPHGTPAAFIDGFVSAHEGWVLNTLDKVKELNEKKGKPVSRIFFLGEEYGVKFGGKSVEFDGRKFKLPEENSRAYVAMWMRRSSESIFSERVEYFAEAMGVTPIAVKVTNARTRWGSCSSKGSINLSWRLIMARGELIDYVVVHELAHLSEMNHSDRFWKIVGQYMPDYRALRSELADFGRMLESEGCMEN